MCSRHTCLGQQHNSKNSTRLCHLLWKQPGASKRPISDLNPTALSKTSIWSSCSSKAWCHLYDKIWSLTQSQVRLPKSERINSINNNVESQVEDWKYPRLQHLTHDYSLTLIITWSKCVLIHIFTCNKFRLEHLNYLACTVFFCSVATLQQINDDAGKHNCIWMCSTRDSSMELEL